MLYILYSPRRQGPKQGGGHTWGQDIQEVVHSSSYRLRCRMYLLSSQRKALAVMIVRRTKRAEAMSVWFHNTLEARQEFWELRLDLHLYSFQVYFKLSMGSHLTACLEELTCPGCTTASRQADIGFSLFAIAVVFHPYVHRQSPAFELWQLFFFTAWKCGCVVWQHETCMREVDMTCFKIHND